MTLHDLNTMPQPQLRQELLNCCGSLAWAKIMLTHFPVDDLVELLENAEEVWFECSEDDWKGAFSHHPKIGDRESLAEKFATTPVANDWAASEQSGVKTASEQTLDALAEGNREYEKKFGFIFIVCATGLSAEEMLEMLNSRLKNSPAAEIKIAADEQNKITKLRIEKMLENR
jgi:2-oxo-4-hydroxy-4-carboxy-5-ureidoimidazoline decarboxylase